MKKFLNGVVCVVLLLAISGCSIFMPWSETITVQGAQEGATIVVNGVPAVNGVADVRCNKPVDIIVRKDGYKPWYAHSTTTLSSTGLADVVGCFLFLVPGVGLFFPGAFNHTKTYFYYDLQPVK